MAYADAQNLIDAMGYDKFAQRESALGDGAGDRALEEAAAEIDSYLCGRYAVPVPTSSNMTRICVQIATYRLLGEAASDRARADYEDAIRWLRDAQAGRASIPSAAVQASGVNQANLTSFANGRDSVFKGGPK